MFPERGGFVRLPQAPTVPLAKPVAAPKLERIASPVFKPSGIAKGPTQFHIHIHLPTLGGRTPRGTY